MFGNVEILGNKAKFKNNEHISVQILKVYCSNNYESEAWEQPKPHIKKLQTFLNKCLTIKIYRSNLLNIPYGNHQKIQI